MNTSKKCQHDNGFPPHPADASAGLAGVNPAAVGGAGNFPCTRNRCATCGRFCGQSFAGYERDRASDRGALICERCFRAKEAHS